MHLSEVKTNESRENIYLSAFRASKDGVNRLSVYHWRHWGIRTASSEQQKHSRRGWERKTIMLHSFFQLVENAGVKIKLPICFLKDKNGVFANVFFFFFQISKLISKLLTIFSFSLKRHCLASASVFHSLISRGHLMLFKMNHFMGSS